MSRERSLLLSPRNMVSPDPKLAPKLAAEDLVDLLIPQEVRLSPSAEQLVYSAKPTGKKGDRYLSSIWLARVGKKHSSRQITSGLYNDRLPRWRPDGKSITFLSDRGKAGASCAIYSLPIAGGGEPVPLTAPENAKEITNYRWSPDGNFIAYVSPDEKTEEKEVKEKTKDDVRVYGAEWEYNRLNVLHLSTGTVTVLYKKEAHVKDFAWRPNSKDIMCLVHDTPDINSSGHKGVRFEKISLLDKLCEHIGDFLGPIKSSLEWIEEADDKKENIYFLAGQTANSSSSAYCIYALSLARRRCSCVVPAIDSDRGLMTSAGHEIATLCMTATEDHIGMHCGEVPSLSSAQEITTFDLGFSGRDKHVLAFVKSSVSSPWEIFTQELSGNEDLEVPSPKSIQVSNLGTSIAKLNLGKAEILHCDSDDGKVQLDGLYLKPTLDQADLDRPLPTVVYIHGGPLLRKIESFDTSHLLWAPMILATGKYGVLIPNYRGNCGKGNDFAMHSRNGVGTQDYDDVLALVDEGIRLGYVDKDRIAVGGWSQGGFLSYLCAVRNGYDHEGNAKDWKFRAVIPGAGVCDWDMECMTSDWPWFESEMTGGPPWTRRSKRDAESKKGSAIWEMAKAAEARRIPPLLIIHGEKDERIPVSQAIAFHRGCLHWKIPCELAIYPREPHLFEERAHLIDMLNRILRFCDMHLATNNRSIKSYATSASTMP